MDEEETLPPAVEVVEDERKKARREYMRVYMKQRREAQRKNAGLSERPDGSNHQE